MKLLIADDYLDNRLLLGQISEILNYEYHMVENGQDAVKYLEQDNTISLVLMDIEMPVMNGIEATKEIRRSNTSVPIIAITAHNPEHFSEKLQSVGFNDYISKPYTMDKIQKIITRFVH